MQAVIFLAIGLAAWVAAVFGPPLIALRLWYFGVGRFPQWIAHLLCGPLLIGVSWACTQVIFFAAHDDGSGPPGLGLALILPFAMLIGSLIVYYGCVCSTLAQSLWRKLDVH